MQQPLAYRMRPRHLDEVVGQQHLVGPGKIIRRMVEAKMLSSMILYGPPGTGKTSIASAIAGSTNYAFRMLNAATDTKKDLQIVAEEAKMSGTVILLLDEIHRLDKTKQDFLLPHLENGRIIMIGATTENPYFEVNGALLSRSIIFELHALEKEDIKKLLVRAVTDKEKGMAAYQAVINEDALEFMADVANGDARAALTAIELGILTTPRSEDGLIHITIDVAQECIQKRVVKYDKAGDNHYDTISAFIKSIRGTDPDAALYYLARMLYAGEDIRFIARRIMISAAEDVGTADPMALNVAVSAAQAVERIGMPEAQIILAEAVAYVASAPKSNASYMGLNRAMDVVEHTKTAPIPNHLKDAHYKSAGKLGHGLGYLYSHDYPHHYVRQQYLPDGLTDSVFYEPTDNGKEKEIAQWLHWLKENDE